MVKNFLNFANSLIYLVAEVRYIALPIEDAVFCYWRRAASNAQRNGHGARGAAESATKRLPSSNAVRSTSLHDRHTPDSRRLAAPPKWSESGQLPTSSEPRQVVAFPLDP